MATSTISNTIKDASGAAVSGVTVVARLKPGPAFRTSDASEVAGQVTTTSNGSGAWTLTLEQQANITPANSWWEIEEQIPDNLGGRKVWAISVGNANATVLASQVGPAPAGIPLFLTQIAGDSRYSFPAAAATAIQYVASNGNDLNDGLSWGKAKATLAAAVAALPAGGGRISVGGGVFLSGPNALPANTHVVGRGIDSTIIRCDPTLAATFNGHSLFENGTTGSGAACRIADLTLDGNNRAGGWTAWAGGSLCSPGDHWNIERVRFYDAPVGKLFVQRSHVRVRGCRWEATASGGDNIGGGFNFDDLIVEDCYWAADVQGNAIDITGATNVTFRNNRVMATNVIYEAVVGGKIESNILSSGTISVQSDAAYSPASTTNSRDIAIIGNTVEPAAGAGAAISVAAGYQPGKPATGCGGIIIVGNTIRRAPKVGILVQAYQDSVLDKPNIIAGNTINGTNTDGSGSTNTGLTVVDNAGIALAAACGDVVSGNVIYDDQTVPTTPYGFCFGGSGGATVRKAHIVNNSFIGVTGLTSRAAGSGCVVRNNIGLNPTGAAPITAGASPYTYTNAENVPQMVYLSPTGAGTITNVAKNSLSIFNQGPCSVWLEPGEALTVTYTGILSMTKDRR